MEGLQPLEAINVCQRSARRVVSVSDRTFWGPGLELVSLDLKKGYWVLVLSDPQSLYYRSSLIISLVSVQYLSLIHI